MDTTRKVLPILLGLLLGFPICAEDQDAVRLLSPPDGMELTDLASYFQWRPRPGVGGYEIQVARDPEFRKLQVAKQLKDVGYHKHLYFPKDPLPAGSYWWRVRTREEEGQTGPWSAAWRISVNAVHDAAPDLVRPITPEKPLFLMRNRAWNPEEHTEHVATTFPEQIRGSIVVDDLAMAGAGVFERAAAYERLGLDFVVWNNRCQVSLATLEYLYQHFPHCLGTAEGEHFSGMYWERGPEGNLAEREYIRRAWTLGAKYGRYYFFADGDNGTYRWPNFATQEKDLLDRHPDNLVAMFKSTNAELALHSYGSVEGLMLAGRVAHCGVWVDEWIWPCYGFGRLGEVIPDADIWANRRKVGTRDCPWSYDIQMWLMGIVSGATVFHLESAHQWGGQGNGAANYRRFFLPFVRAVVERGLIPSRPAFRAATRLGVVSDPALARGKHGGVYGPPFRFLGDLYGLTDRGSREIIPNQGRYGIIPILPPGTAQVPGIDRLLPLADLQDPAKALKIFHDAYPARFSAEAFMWECDRTIIITNTNENQDLDQGFTMPLDCAPVRAISGIAEVHRYLIGKIAADRKGLWFQTNAENPRRPLSLVLHGPAKPVLTVAPTAALRSAEWSPTTQSLQIVLSQEEGPVEVQVR